MLTQLSKLTISVQFILQFYRNPPLTFPDERSPSEVSLTRSILDRDMIMRHLFFLATVAAGVLAGAASADEHRVQMLNKGGDGQMMAFEPAFLRVLPGDTIVFVPTDRSHNAETIPELTPNSAQGWSGEIGREVTVTLTQPGLYGYRCKAHYPMGMVGLIQVGSEVPNLDEVQSALLPGRASERMKVLVSQVSISD